MDYKFKKIVMYGNFRSKTLSFRKMKSVFRDVK